MQPNPLTFFGEGWETRESGWNPDGHTKQAKLGTWMVSVNKATYCPVRIRHNIGQNKMSNWTCIPIKHLDFKAFAHFYSFSYTICFYKFTNEYSELPYIKEHVGKARHRASGFKHRSVNRLKVTPGFYWVKSQVGENISWADCPQLPHTNTHWVCQFVQADYK